MKHPKQSFVFIGGTSEPGGLHVHTTDVALAIANTGHDVSIVCPSVDHFSAMLAGSPVRVEMIPPRHAHDATLLYWRRNLARHRRATAVFCRGILGESSIADVWGIRLATRRLFTIEHRSMGPALPDPHVRRLHGWSMRALVRRAVVVSDEIAREAMTQLGLPRARISTCLNWFDPIFQPVSDAQRDEAKRQLGLRPETLVVGFHGRLAPEKRVDALIEAFARLRVPDGRDVRLVLVGDGWKRRELEELIRARNLGPRVLLTGWHPDPRAALAAFDISVLPSLQEGFPLGLLEAMACGAVCLAHPMISTCAIISSGVDGRLADLQEPASFAAALQELVDMPAARRTAWGLAASANMAQHYAREKRLPSVLAALEVDTSNAKLPTRERNLMFTR